MTGVMVTSTLVNSDNPNWLHSDEAKAHRRKLHDLALELCPNGKVLDPKQSFGGSVNQV